MICWSLRLKQCGTFVIFLTILISTIISVYGENDWLPEEKFGLLGVNVEVYFTPKPGKISIELEVVKGIINITRVNNDYNLRVGILYYGTIQENVTIFNNTGIREIFFSTSIDSHLEQISLKTPENGSFISYMVIVFLWEDTETLLIENNKTVKLAADYEKHFQGFDLANIVIPGMFIVFLAGMVFLYSSRIKKRPSKKADINGINEKVEEIFNSTKNFFTRGGELKELDLSKIKSTPSPGEIWLLKQKKKKLLKKLSSLKPKLDELNRIALRLERAREPVEKNELFKFISSFFIRASRKREVFPPGDDIGNKVRLLRDELKEGKWERLQNIENIKIMWFICDKYTKATIIHKELPLNDDFDITDESIILGYSIKRYFEIKNSTHWPPDRNMTLKAEEDILAELKIIDGLQENYKKLKKKTLKNYASSCSKILKEAEVNLKWLKSLDPETEVELAERMIKRLQQLVDLMIKELDLINKLN
ncbi:MAG: hypothetical protein ACFE9L_18115 [Candidatus Hodarchaeota archaeon]